MIRHYMIDENFYIGGSFSKPQKKIATIPLEESDVDQFECPMYINEEIVNDDSLELNKYKISKKNELKIMIKENWPLGIDKTEIEVRNKWANFKSNASSLTTKEQVDDAFDAAIAWLNITD